MFVIKATESSMRPSCGAYESLDLSCNAYVYLVLTVREEKINSGGTQRSTTLFVASETPTEY